MSKAAAQGYYNKQATDGETGYVSAQDAKDAINVIYTDMDSLLADATPANLAGTAQVGTSLQLAREDHVHSYSGLSLSGHTHPQSDVTNLSNDLALKAPLASPIFTGNPQAPTPTAGDNDTSIATTAFVTAAVTSGTSGGAPLASPTFTGDPKAPTPTAGDNDTSIATTAFVSTAVTNHSGLADPHTFYQLKSQKDQASGYAGLNGSSKIAIAQLPLTFTNTVIATVFDSTKYLSLDVNGTVYKVALVQ